ncbi:hypothetical protein L1049_005427 [Liquidambar formosana]|uniref:Uncharacterized protein n=1 Tax=Liquidambar formosana TaxID=63359 RepID=A0AAP0RPX1_LIQFO
MKWVSPVMLFHSFLELLLPFNLLIWHGSSRKLWEKMASEDFVVHSDLITDSSSAACSSCQSENDKRAAQVTMWCPMIGPRSSQHTEGLDIWISWVQPCLMLRTSAARFGRGLSFYYGKKHSFWTCSSLLTAQ